MGQRPLIFILSAIVLVSASAFLFWRYIWFFRNPARVAPPGESIVSPADGTVVYVKKVDPNEEVISIKKGVKLHIHDIVREDMNLPKVVIGVFMSPFNVHYNRAPMNGRIDFVRHHPSTNGNHHMGPMHLRILLNRPPYYSDSIHIGENERTVTKIIGDHKGAAFHCYVVQIAGKNVTGIDSYVTPGDNVAKGQLFGMIRIGSQVDLVLPQFPGMRINVAPGNKVRAGETILVE
jgi:phosphatidylserine decarboxylase